MTNLFLFSMNELIYENNVHDGKTIFKVESNLCKLIDNQGVSCELLKYLNINDIKSLFQVSIKYMSILDKLFLIFNESYEMLNLIKSMIRVMPLNILNKNLKFYKFNLQKYKNIGKKILLLENLNIYEYLKYINLFYIYILDEDDIINQYCENNKLIDSLNINSISLSKVIELKKYLYNLKFSNILFLIKFYEIYHTFDLSDVHSDNKFYCLHNKIAKFINLIINKKKNIIKLNEYMDLINSSDYFVNRNIINNKYLEVTNSLLYDNNINFDSNNLIIKNLDENLLIDFIDIINITSYFDINIFPLIAIIFKLFIFKFGEEKIMIAIKDNNFRHWSSLNMINFSNIDYQKKILINIIKQLNYYMIYFNNRLNIVFNNKKIQKLLEDDYYSSKEIFNMIKEKNLFHQIYGNFTKLITNKYKHTIGNSKDHEDFDKLTKNNVIINSDIKNYILKVYDDISKYKNLSLIYKYKRTIIGWLFVSKNHNLFDEEKFNNIFIDVFQSDKIISDKNINPQRQIYSLISFLFSLKNEEILKNLLDLIIKNYYKISFTFLNAQIKYVLFKIISEIDQNKEYLKLKINIIKHFHIDCICKFICEKDKKIIKDNEIIIHNLHCTENNDKFIDIYYNAPMIYIHSL